MSALWKGWAVVNLTGSKPSAWSDLCRQTKRDAVRAYNDALEDPGAFKHGESRGELACLRVTMQLAGGAA